MASLVNYAALNNGRVGTVASSSDSNSVASGAEVGTGSDTRACWQSLNLNHYGSENNEIQKTI